VLGLNWRANFVVSLLISVFSFHLFFNPSHHNLYRRHHFFPHPQNLSAHLSHQRLRHADLRRPQQTLHRTAALPRGAFRRTGSVPVRSLRLKKSKATRQQIKKKKQKKTKQRKTEKKKQKKERGTIRSAVFLPPVSGSQRAFLLLCLYFSCLCYLSALVISSVCDGLSTLI
jgi:hypothetical protein